MRLKDKGMIIYKCDFCKQEIPKGQEYSLILRVKNEATQKFLMWDIHNNCLHGLQEMLGEGRGETYVKTGRT